MIIRLIVCSIISSWHVSNLSWMKVSRISSHIQWGFFFCFGFFLNKVVLMPCLWMHKGWHLYCTDKAWHLHWYKARHSSMCAGLLFHLYFWCSLYSVIRILSWETSKASKSFTFPPADPLHIMFWLSRKLFSQHSLAGDVEILISVKRIFSQVSYLRKYCFPLYAVVLLGK